MTSPQGLLCFIKYLVDLELLWQMWVEILKPSVWSWSLRQSLIHQLLATCCMVSRAFLPACHCIHPRSEDECVLLLLLCLYSLPPPLNPQACPEHAAVLSCFYASFAFLLLFSSLWECTSQDMMQLNEWKMEEKRQPHMFSLLLSLLPGGLGVLSWGSMQPRRCLAATLAKAANYIFHLDKNGGFLPMLLIIMKGI